MRRNPPPSGFVPDRVERVVGVIQRQNTFEQALSKGQFHLISGVQAALNYIGSNVNEFMLVIHVNAQGLVSGYSEFTSGNQGLVSFSTGGIVRDSVLCGGRKAMVFHQHPSGDPTPSKEDVDSLKAIVVSLQVIDVELMESVVLGETAFTAIKSGRIVPYAFANIKKAP